MDKRVWFMMIALVGIGLACGSASLPSITQGAVSTLASAATQPISVEPTDTAVPQAANVGDRIEINGVALTVVNFKTLTVINEIWKPQTEGNVFVVTEVLLENTGTDKIAYNLLYFKLKDGDGFEYTVALVAPDPSLGSGELVAGDKVRGNIAFEVKATAKSLVLTYQPIQFGNDVTLKVRLGDTPSP